MKACIVLAMLTISVVPAAAQSPYAGSQTRAIKALSDQQVADLHAGRGMGLALAAELNGYPGPVHVIELADQLELSAEQRTAVQALYASMKQEAVTLGRTLIEQEAALDRQFAARSITPAQLNEMTRQTAVTNGALRETHLKYHLATLAILNPNQTRRYAQLREYTGASVGPAHRHKH